MYKRQEHAEAMVGINTYAQGVTYYIARVKHFGSLTPWNSGESYGCLLYTSSPDYGASPFLNI